MAASKKAPVVAEGATVKVCIGKVRDGDRGFVEKWRTAKVVSQEPDGRLNAIVSTTDGDEAVLGPAAKSGHYEVAHAEHLHAHREDATHPGLSWLDLAEYAERFKPAPAPAAATPPPPPAKPAARPPAPKVNRHGTAGKPPISDADAAADLASAKAPAGQDAIARPADAPPPSEPDLDELERLTRPDAPPAPTAPAADDLPL